MGQWILAALLVLFALPAWAADTNEYPSTLMDQTCTDDNNVPAAVTPGLLTIGGTQPIYAVGALVQISGTADGFCDNDSRIVATIATPVSADTSWGPFTLADGLQGFYLFVDADTVAGPGTPNDTWTININAAKPHDGVMTTIEITIAEDTAGLATGDFIYVFGSETTRNPAKGSFMNGPLPNPFYIMYNEQSATGFTGDISLVPFYQ